MKSTTRVKAVAVATSLAFAVSGSGLAIAEELAQGNAAEAEQSSEFVMTEQTDGFENAQTEDSETPAADMSAEDAASEGAAAASYGEASEYIDEGEMSPSGMPAGGDVEGLSSQAEAIRPSFWMGEDDWRFDEKYDVIDSSAELPSGVEVKDPNGGFPYSPGKPGSFDPEKLVKIENSGSEGPWGLYWIEGDKYVRVPWTIDYTSVNEDELTATGKSIAGHPEYFYRGVNYYLMDGILRRDLQLGGDYDSGTSPVDSSSSTAPAPTVAGFDGYQPGGAQPTPATGSEYVPAANVTTSEVAASTKTPTSGTAEAAIPSTGDPMSIAGAIVATVSSVVAFGAAKVFRRRS